MLITMLLLKKYKYHLLLLLISISVYGVTLIYAPIYDYMDGYFPHRHYIINGFSNGLLPFWLPYTCLGMPVFADPQSNFFYLPVWIWTLFGDYTPVMWGIGAIFNGFMAGAGFFALTRRFVKNDKTAFIMGTCYLMSGFLIGNMQHLTWIIAAVWLPWLLNSLINLMENPSPKNAILMAIFAALLFTGGYPGIPFMLVYLVTIIVVYHIVIHLKKRDLCYIKRFVPALLLGGGLCLVLTLPELIGLIEVQQYITRGNALDYAVATASPYTLQSLISLPYPLVACSEPTFTHTDISTGSIYIGILTLFFAALGIVKKKEGILKILLYWGLFCFLISLGKLLPLHKWAFNWLPLISFIRILPLFRIFVIIALLLLAAKGLDEVVDNFSKYRKPIIVFVLAGMVVCLVVAVVSKNVETPFSHKFLYCALMQFVFFGLMMLALAKKKGNWQFPVIVAIWILEMTVNAGLCLRHTGFDKNYTNRQFSEMLSQFSKGYPIPDRVTSPIELIHDGRNWGHSWRTLGMLAKEVEGDDFIALQIKTHNEMCNPYSVLEKELLLPAVVFFPKQIIYADAPILFSVDTAYTYHSQEVADYSATDSASVIITRFEPCRIELHTYTDSMRPLVICQNYYPGWTAQTKEGKGLKINILNHALMSITTPKGETDLILSFKRPDIAFALYLSLAAWLGILLFFILSCFKIGLHKICKFNS